MYKKRNLLSKKVMGALMLSACSLTLGLLLPAGPAVAQQPTSSRTFTIPANKAYVVPLTNREDRRPPVKGRDAAQKGKRGASKGGFNPQGVSVPVGYPQTILPVSHWTDSAKSVVWYLYQQQGHYNFSLDAMLSKSTDLPFEISITDADPNTGFKAINKVFTMHGSGSKDTTAVCSVDIPKTGYYRYALKPKADPRDAITLYSLLFSTNGSEKSEVHQTDYQSSPSVHLSFSSTAPTTKSYDWIYAEILVPEGGDPLATYYESLGFYRGYMGIQTNGLHERRVLFSVWDSKDAEKDKSIEKSDYVTLVAKGPQTVTNSFGGEGTGGQSYNPGANWQTGKPVHFLMNLLPDTNGSVVISAWYQIDTQPWVYVASWRAPKENRYFDGFYSFIENYGYANGWMRRMAYYYNAWGKQSGGGSWVSLNKVKFSHTDGKPGQRIDYEQGVSDKYPDRFYMASGGYTPTRQTASQVPLGKIIPIKDLSPFEKEVQNALNKSAARPE
ncbi:DUF3472 domain-containing protein [Arachidicoccus rhizosphaerae]|nr:DUF3472 domain-containing protein [Arachidicoccus rhizosphaerae]